ncbi:MAG: hypothetical protein O2868_13305 [Proteobacteria bacterium]|nr:hypothetical protein [Pseudomonadota bacterium]
MSTFLHDYLARLRRASDGHAEGFHGSSLVQGASVNTSLHDYGVADPGPLRAPTVYERCLARLAARTNVDPGDTIVLYDQFTGYLSLSRD